MKALATSKFKHLAIVSNLIIWILSLAPIGDHVPQPISGSDLIYHGIAYMVLALLFLKGFPNHILRVSALLFIQGVLIEVIQPYTGRFFEWWDMLANSIGIFLGVALYSFSREPRSTKSTGPSK